MTSPLFGGRNGNQGRDIPLGRDFPGQQRPGDPIIQTTPSSSLVNLLRGGGGTFGRRRTPRLLGNFLNEGGELSGLTDAGVNAQNLFGVLRNASPQGFQNPRGPQNQFSRFLQDNRDQLQQLRLQQREQPPPALSPIQQILESGGDTTSETALSVEDLFGHLFGGSLF